MVIRIIRKLYRSSKPLLDYFNAIIILLITSPVLFLVGLMVKLTSPGPVFYTQERVGKDGCLFGIIKFRTMCVDAESQVGPVWAKKGDKRITTVGRFLRRTHLDELPQLINVIKGEMSIIGPRPERPFFVNKFEGRIPDYAERLSVRPGITGMAQCYQNKYDENVRDVEKKLRYDMLYIKRMCWMLDFKILLLTFRVSLSGEVVK